MRKTALLGLGMLAVLACSTHPVRDCRPPCGDADREIFARCVANGNEMPPCRAGNRMCCATMVAHCLGALDDQTVVTTMPDCSVETPLDSGECEHPCGAAEEEGYQACLGGGSAACDPDDLECCALAANCLGTLGDPSDDSDVIVEHDGCCVDATDCPSPLVCDPMFWTCMGGSPACGDGTMSATEECDDHNTVTEPCAYGLMSCVVCDASCHMAPGAAHFCGDDTIDLTEGESCEPPDEPLICDAACHSLQPASCTNSILDGTETSIDCGGRECAACLSGEFCSGPSDCRPAHAIDCPGSMTDCGTSDGLCAELHRCTDTDPCTDDGCDAAGSCTRVPLDRDGDGDGPLGCGGDCDDRNVHVFEGAIEMCDGLDNDCDETVDEACT